MPMANCSWSQVAPVGSGTSARAAGVIAVGVLVQEPLCDVQSFSTARGAVGLARSAVMMRIEGDVGDAIVAGEALVNVPSVKGHIRGEMHGILLQSHYGALIAGTEIGHVAIVGAEGSHHIRAIASHAFLNFFGRAIELMRFVPLMQVYETIAHDLQGTI